LDIETSYKILPLMTCIDNFFVDCNGMSQDIFSAFLLATGTGMTGGGEEGGEKGQVNMVDLMAGIKQGVKLKRVPPPPPIKTNGNTLIGALAASLDKIPLSSTDETSADNKDDDRWSPNASPVGKKPGQPEPAQSSSGQQDDANPPSDPPVARNISNQQAKTLQDAMATRRAGIAGSESDEDESWPITPAKTETPKSQPKTPDVEGRGQIKKKKFAELQEKLARLLPGGQTVAKPEVKPEAPIPESKTEAQVSDWFSDVLQGIIDKNNANPAEARSNMKDETIKIISDQLDKLLQLVDLLGPVDQASCSKDVNEITRLKNEFVEKIPKMETDNVAQLRTWIISEASLYNTSFEKTQFKVKSCLLSRRLGELLKCDDETPKETLFGNMYLFERELNSERSQVTKEDIEKLNQKKQKLAQRLMFLMNEAKVEIISGYTMLINKSKYDETVGELREKVLSELDNISVAPPGENAAETYVYDKLYAVHEEANKLYFLFMDSVFQHLSKTMREMYERFTSMQDGNDKEFEKGLLLNIAEWVKYLVAEDEDERYKKYTNQATLIETLIEKDQLPSIDTATPSSATPSTATPSSATPSSATPSSATSSSATSSATPSSATPSSATSSTATSSTATPSTAKPSTDTPSGSNNDIAAFQQVNKIWLEYDDDKTYTDEALFAFIYLYEKELKAVKSNLSLEHIEQLNGQKEKVLGRLMVLMNNKKSEIISGFVDVLEPIDIDDKVDGLKSRVSSDLREISVVAPDENSNENYVGEELVSIHKRASQLLDSFMDSTLDYLLEEINKGYKKFKSLSDGDKKNNEMNNEKEKLQILIEWVNYLASDDLHKGYLDAANNYWIILQSMPTSPQKTRKDISDPENWPLRPVIKFYR
jgi:hypothetical protein